MRNINNKIIVVGKDHYNALSVIRSLGRSGIKPVFLLIGRENYYYPSKSKYVGEFYQIDSEDDIVDKLITLHKNYQDKPILIPTGDPIEKIFDLNYNKLSKYYYLPNINNKQGEIVKLMDKTYQEELCHKYGIKIARSILIDTGNFKYSDKYPPKVILKPYISADGKKADIIIAKGREEIINGVNTFKRHGYKKIMMQEFLDYDIEYAMMGMSYKGKVLIPGINSNDYIYPSERGNTSYATMFPPKDFIFDISNIIKMVSDLNYTGLFEIETFKMGNTLYFNEMNFRNSANLLGYSGDKIHYVLLYIMQILGMDISSMKQSVTKKYHFCVENHHLKNVREGRLGIFKCLYHIIISTNVIFVFSDIRPLRYKVSHFLKKKFKHTEE